MTELVITAESHNQVTWKTRYATVPILIGVLAVTALSAALLSLVPSPHRWPVIGGVGGTTLLALAWIAWQMPLAEDGSLERLPDGGAIRRSRRWLWQRTPYVAEIPLADVSGLWVESRTFEETGGHTYDLARLWALSASDAPLLLTDWLEPEQVQSLGRSMAKAGRLSFGDA